MDSRRPALAADAKRHGWRKTLIASIVAVGLSGCIVFESKTRTKAYVSSPLTREAIWADADAQTVFEEKFESVGGRGLQPWQPSELPSRPAFAGVLEKAGHDKGQCYALEFELPAKKSQVLYLPVPPQNPAGIYARFYLKVETEPRPDPGNLAMTLGAMVHRRGAPPDAISELRVHYSEPLQENWTKTGEWMNQVTPLFWKRHIEYIHDGWVLYEADTAKSFLQVPTAESEFVGIGISLANQTQIPLKIRVWIDDVRVIRRDILNKPELRAVLDAPRPILCYTRTQILRAKQRLETLGEKATPSEVRANLALADKWVAQEIAVPMRRAGYPAQYYCQAKDCGAEIYPNPSADFACRKCGHKHTGELYDGLRALSQHQSLANAAAALGFAWQWTGDERYARKAEEILLAYAEATPKITPTLGHNWLGDCWLMANLLQSYDYIYEWLSPQSREAINERLLMTEVRRIYHYNVTHYPEGYTALWKICSWAAILAKNPEWAHYLIFSPTGNREASFRYGLTADGMSTKGAAYHGDIMRGHAAVGVTIENCGVKYFDSRFRLLFDAIPNLCLPDGSLPAFGHSNVGLGAQAYNMDIAYTYYKDPVFLALAPASFRTQPNIFAPTDDPLPPVQPLRLPSTHMAALGMTILRTQPENQAALALNWGAPQRNDPARLDFQFYGAGGELIWSSGITGYGNAFLGKWYLYSVSRNAVALDEASQTPVSGRCLFLQTGGKEQIVVAELRDAYPESRLVRVAVLFPDGEALLVDLVASPRPRKVDWVCQLPGALEANVKLAPIASPFAGTNGYGVLEEISQAEGPGPFALVLRHKGRGVRLLAAPVEGTLLYVAKGRTGTGSALSPVCLFRRNGVSRAVYANLLQPFVDSVPSAGEVNILETTEGKDWDYFSMVKVRVQTALKTYLVTLRESVRDKATPQERVGMEVRVQ